jgi:D-beta-D-heptose 7-phosphate kinase/D-beta-D-heptose 1-phosphate adenosyltransferase
MGQVVDLQTLVALRAQAEDQGRSVVFTNGCFDLLHLGHVRYLRQARSLGDLLVVGVNSDRSVEVLKGPSRPVVPQDERAEVLAALESVDLVTIFDEEDPGELIEAVQPDVLVKGGDWPLEEIVGRETVIARGGKVLALPYVAGMATSSMIERILRRSSTDGERSHR